MLGTSARLLRLLSLFQARRYWTGAELCVRLSITPRTLRRDVDKLRSLGYPVHSTSGASGGYQLGAGATLPPLLLDNDEAVAVAVGLRTAAGGTVAGIEESSVRALSKLEQVLPKRLRERVAALHSAILPLVRTGPLVDAATLAAIASACRNLEGLCFEYCHRDGAATARAVEPHQLIHTGERWYLAAWDTSRGEWRTFRVDRIQPKLTPGPRFAQRKPPEGGFDRYVSRSISSAPYQHRAVVVLEAPARTIAARVPPGAGKVEPIDDRTCRLRTGSHSLDMLAVYLGALGAEFHVIEPPELFEHLRVMARRFQRAARAQKPARRAKSLRSRHPCPSPRTPASV